MMQSGFKWVMAVISLMILSACTTTASNSGAVRLDPGWQPIPGISGMAAISENAFLTVHDAKSHKPTEPRLGVLTIDRINENILYKTVDFPNAASSPSSDLEDVCALPSRPGEFIVNESGTWQGDFGRLFHIRLQGDQAELISEHKLPFTRDNNPDQSDGDQYEGLACAAKSDGTVLLLLGERGGTSRTPQSLLRWGTYDISADTVTWNESEISVSAPDRFGVSGLRSITALSIDAANMLWASASVDSDTDLGPFRSVVYPVGRMTPDAAQPVQKLTRDRIWIIEALKVEGLETHGGMSIGSEDENLGGVWRQLPSTPTRR